MIGKTYVGKTFRLHWSATLPSSSLGLFYDTCRLVYRTSSHRGRERHWRNITVGIFFKNRTSVKGNWFVSKPRVFLTNLSLSLIAKICVVVIRLHSSGHHFTLALIPCGQCTWFVYSRLGTSKIIDSGVVSYKSLHCYSSERLLSLRSQSVWKNGGLRALFPKTVQNKAFEDFRNKFVSIFNRR